MGPLIIDFQSTQLTEHEKVLLQHPLVGGVILFTRNFDSSSQLKILTDTISQLRPDCLICVDHEGGRVQRFRGGDFTMLPAMGKLKSTQQAYDCGVIMAYELKSHGIHLNFAPVLDRDLVSNVIGDRGFSAYSDDIVKYANQLICGMDKMSMPACGKHFPGHGSVEADSHIACPVDPRPYSSIQDDIEPFAQLIEQQKLSAVMPAHVVYPDVCALPAGYSKRWIQQELNQKWGFKGLVFSDDLSMEGASLAGTHGQRAFAAYEAGCDFLLLCNAPQHIEPVLKELENKITVKELPNTKPWFQPLPDDADSRYKASLDRLKRDTYCD